MSKRMIAAGICVVAILSLALSRDAMVVERQTRAPGDLNAPLNQPWIHGSEDCRANRDPAFQIRKLDPDTYIIRQNRCLDFEAPFMYLLFGQRRALLLDSGSTTPPASDFQIANTVQKIIDEWLAAHSNVRSVDLVVAHSHNHGDHTFGDSQFAVRRNTTVVPHNPRDVQSFFRLTNWPNRSADFDLGGRMLTIIPIPGHEPSHIALYDAKTKALFTGDTLYPGVLVVRDWQAYRLSIRRLALFASSHPISHVLGAHIEMTNTAAKCYPIGKPFQPSEHLLDLSADQLKELDQACSAMADRPHRDVHNHFIICPNCNNCEPDDH